MIIRRVDTGTGRFGQWSTGVIAAAVSAHRLHLCGPVAVGRQPSAVSRQSALRKPPWMGLPGKLERSTRVHLPSLAYLDKDPVRILPRG
jgi:hypothetical protein